MAPTVLLYLSPLPATGNKTFKGILADMLTDKYLDPQATPLSPILGTALLDSVPDVIVVRE